ncbi:hypothetical protein K438DRAFT_1817875 [Mycena galopus ATCC 62051]|nr:hypothetical protein K438DRAFT_1817875 [Mycena galopus ATCC 62051]
MWISGTKEGCSKWGDTCYITMMSLGIFILVCEGFTNLRVLVFVLLPVAFRLPMHILLCPSAVGRLPIVCGTIVDFLLFLCCAVSCSCLIFLCISGC